VETISFRGPAYEHHARLILRPQRASVLGC
jgi:hypothetical protein